MKFVQRTDCVLEGSSNRVLCRMFIPGEEELIQGKSRIPQVVERVLELSDEQVLSTLRAVERDYAGRHRDLDDHFQCHFRAVAHLVPDDVTPQRRALIGAYFTQEYAIEGAAYFNPSIVPAPEEPDSDAEVLRFVMSVRAVGEGHISTIVFRSGSVASDGSIHIDKPSPYASTRADRFTILRSRLVRQAAIEAGVDTADLELVLGMLPDKFTPEELLTSLTQLDLAGVRHAPSQGLIDTMEHIARSSYEVDFPVDSQVSERVLWPTAPDERRGMEDARFVRLLDSDEPVRYRASYTAFDGSGVSTRMLETDDFRSFSSVALTGPGVRNKGLAFFPRRIDGTYCALSRHDRESISLAFSSDGYHWNDVSPLASARQPWELVHMGNCGSPIETAAGWLVLTHGAGPMREYCIGAILLDRENPRKVLGRLTEPLLRPMPDERNGYVPNVVYACGSLLHRDQLILPYGFSDWRIRFATVDVNDLLTAMR
jgi:predicted GH43/DUF377 family glycosyl hydrolase